MTAKFVDVCLIWIYACVFCVRQQMTLNFKCFGSLGYTIALAIQQMRFEILWMINYDKYDKYRALKRLYIYMWSSLYL